MSIKFPFSTDQSEILATITNARVSVMQTKMIGQCTPTDKELEQIFKSAMSVSDHGQIHPAQFIIIKGEKTQAFIREMYRIKLVENPNFLLSEAEYVTNFSGVGMFIVAYADIKECNIPAYEQEWSVAASIQNMLNLCYAFGYAAKWNSIYKHQDGKIKQYLNVKDHWVSMGYIMIGKSADTAKKKNRPNVKDHFITL